MNEQSDETLPPPRSRRIDKVCGEFKVALQAGKAVSLENYVDRVGESEQPTLRRKLEAVEAQFRRPPRQAGKIDASRRDPGVAKFTRSLVESRLMTRDEVQQFNDSLPEDERPQTAEQYAKLLFRKKRLTKFQAQAVYQGKTRGLAVGNYVVLDRIGAGGMGQVYKARHRRMDRVVALKVLPSSATKSPESVARFHQEVKAAAQLSHPNVVTAYDADEDGGIHFLVMEFVEGSDLSVLVKTRGPRPVREAVDLVLQSARGLEYAHGKNIIHRDIKPANLLLDTSGTVKILDMGLARFDSQPGGDDPTAEQGLTQSGQVMGTLDYMSPEQAVDTHRAGPPADIYSLGCTFFYLLMARSVYGGNTLTKKILSHREKPIPSLTALRADVPASLDRVFQKMLAKAPRDRQASMTEVIAELEASLQETAEEMTVAAAPNPAAPETTRVAPPIPSPSPAVMELPIIVTDASEAPADTDSIMMETSPDNWLDARVPSIVTNVPKPVRRSPPSWLKNKKVVIGGAIAVGLVGLLLLSGIVVSLQTPDGTLVVEINEPGSKVEILDAEGQVKITRAAEGKTITIAVDPGKHRLRISKDGFAFYATREFTIESGGRTVVRARLKPLAPDTPFPSPSPVGPTLPEVSSPAPPPTATVQSQNASPSTPPSNVAKLHVLLVTGDKEFVKWPFYALFDSIPDITYDETEYPAAADLLTPALSSRYDAVVFYDGQVDGITTEQQQALGELLGSGIGVVVLHHAIISHPQWPEHSRIIGGKFHYEDRVVDGKTVKHGGVAMKHDYQVNVADSSHPITRGLANFDLQDEIFLGIDFGADNEVLLTTVHEGLEIPMAWVRTYEKSRVCYLQPGHDRDTYEHPTYRELVARAIRWTTFHAITPSTVTSEQSPRDDRAAWSTILSPDAPPPAVAPFDEAQATQHQQAWADYLDVPVETTNSVGMKMVLIPPGEFMMGSTAEEQARFLEEARADDYKWGIERIPAEGPRREVRITRPFRFSRYEVTRGQFRQFVEATEYKTELERNGEGGYGHVDGKLIEDPRFVWNADLGFEQTDEHPVINVSWNDASAFCQWLSEKQGAEHVLPTEAQWEYACRAGTTTAWHSGDSVTTFEQYAWSKVNARGKPHQVGQLKPNGWSLYDMHGNVCEWCADWHIQGYYSQSPPNDDPKGPTAASHRVYRGGSWDIRPRDCRSADRCNGFPEHGRTHLGFRVAATIEIAKPEAPEPAAKPGWTDLFNGRDLTGWQAVGHDGWSAQDGVLTGETADSRGWLMSTAEFGDFDLELEYLLTNRSNSGVFLRAWPEGSTNGGDFHEIQLLDDTAASARAGNTRTGSLHGRLAAQPVLRPVPNLWHRLNITVVGDRVRVAINAQEVLDGQLPAGKRPRGRIGLQLYPTHVEFRNIRVRELPQQ